FTSKTYNINIPLTCRAISIKAVIKVPVTAFTLEAIACHQDVMERKATWLFHTFTFTLAHKELPHVAMELSS
ncbi:hypothetical protein P7K49_025491, partial [Saguinus oedipus]